MAKAYEFLANGFEDIEALAPVDIPVSYTHLDVYKRQKQGMPKLRFLQAIGATINSSTVVMHSP